VRSRTIDLLPVVIPVVEIVRNFDLAERQDDLMLRLELGSHPTCRRSRASAMAA
jgi:hypothetical protein